MLGMPLNMNEKKNKQVASVCAHCSAIAYCLFVFFLPCFLVKVFCTENYADAVSCTYSMLYCVSFAFLSLDLLSIQPFAIPAYPFRGWCGACFAGS